MIDPFVDNITEMVMKAIEKYDLQAKPHDPGKLTAYHEAGHAFLGIYHNIPPYEATIIRDPEKGTLGHVTPGYLQCTMEYDFGESRVVYIGDPGSYYSCMGIEEEHDPALVMLSESVSGMLAELLYSGSANGGDSGRISGINVIYAFAMELRIFQKN